MSPQEPHGTSPSSTKTLRATAVLLVLIVAVFYLSTEHEGDHWGDDFALYLHHAKNIATGIPYVQTGYVFNPRTPDYSPAYYPPVFPLALSIVYSFRGLDWHALKVEQSIFLLCAALAIGLYFRRWLSPWLALLLFAIVACNPQFYLFHDLLGAEPLFLCLLFFTLERLERVFQRTGTKGALTGGFFLGLLFYLCIGCRSAGLVLLPGAWAFAILRHRRVPKVLAVATALSLALLAVQKVTLGPDLYLAQFHPTLQVIAANLYGYGSASQDPWNPGIGLWPAHAIAAVAWVLAALGFFNLMRLRCIGDRAVEWFAVFYLPLILAWPAAQSFRFLLPLFPLFVFYMLQGSSWLVSRLHGERRQWAWVLLVLAITVNYGFEYKNRVSMETIREAEGLSTFNELCAYTREHVPPGDRIMFSRARLLSLVTDRPSMTYDHTHDFNGLWNLMQGRQIRYLCVSRILPYDSDDLAPLVASEQSKLKPVFENRDFTLYEVLSY
ncbi:MAG: hypothetical protein WBW33_09260 [Bryobacteraceae bacterium]